MTKGSFTGSPDEWEFALYDEAYNKTIDGKTGDRLNVIISIYDLALAQTQYQLDEKDYGSSPVPGKAAIIVDVLLGNTTQHYLRSKPGSGTINITQDNGRVTLEFTNLMFEGGYTASGRLIY